jgi:hypothetical protein
VSAAAIFDQLASLLEAQLSDEAMLVLAEWIAALVAASYRQGREDGLFDS